MKYFTIVKQGMNRAASFAQSAIHAVDASFTFGILDRTLVHIRLSLLSLRKKIMGNIKSWLLAVRPKTLTASFVPVVVGTCLAKSIGAHISLLIFFSALLTAIFIQIGTNFINDALDFKKGADTKQRLGPLRVTQSGLMTVQQVHAGGLICFLLAIFFGLQLIYAGGYPIAILLAFSVLFGYLYTGGPMPLAYVGLGDIFVLLFFGFASTTAVYFLQTHNLDLKPFVAGAQVGLLATVLIAINNLRDIKEDSRAYKRTLAVRFGITFARYEIACLAILPFILSFYWMYLGLYYAALMPLLSLPIAMNVVKSVWSTEPGREYNQFLAKSALLQVSFGLLLSIGLLL